MRRFIVIEGKAGRFLPCLYGFHKVTCWGLGTSFGEPVALVLEHELSENTLSLYWSGIYLIIIATKLRGSAKPLKAYSMIQHTCPQLQSASKWPWKAQLIRGHQTYQTSRLYKAQLKQFPPPPPETDWGWRKNSEGEAQIVDDTTAGCCKVDYDDLNELFWTKAIYKYKLFLYFLSTGCWNRSERSDSQTVHHSACINILLLLLFAVFQVQQKSSELNGHEDKKKPQKELY